MKSVFKRFLLLGISLTVVVLVAAQSWETADSEPAPTNDDPDPAKEVSGSSARLPEYAEPCDGETLTAAPDSAIAFHPLAGTTVTFSGTVIRAGSQFALRETAGILYTLDSAGRAWPFEGEDVRVTGKLDTSTRLLQIDDIQSMIA
jgi:hypothetical protein